MPKKITEDEARRKNLEFDLANIQGFVSVAEDNVKHVLERRARLIRQATEDGMSLREIASRMGISHQRVAQIVGPPAGSIERAARKWAEPDMAKARQEAVEAADKALKKRKR